MTNDPIVYSEGFSDEATISIMDPDGSDRRLVLRHPYVYAPALSPDRLTVAFIGPVDDSNARFGVWTAPVAGGTPRQVIGSTQWSANDVDWSPDGSTLVFAVMNLQQTLGTGGVSMADPANPGWVIRTVRLDGTDERLVAKNASDPRWSPDGSKIAFFRSGEGIGTVRPDGTGLTMLAGGANPDWSPDGRYIVYTGNGTVYIMDAEGRGQRTLLQETFGDNAYFTPSWSSDGKAIAVQFDEGSTRGIAVVRPDGTDYRRIATGAGMTSPRFPPRRNG